MAWERRWARMLSTAAAVAFARSLVAPKGAIGGAAVSTAPVLSHVLAAGSDGGDRCPCSEAFPVCIAGPTAPSLPFGSGLLAASGGLPLRAVDGRCPACEGP